MTPALPNSSPGSLAPRNFRASLIWMVAVSLALQIAAIALLHQYRVRSTNDHFEFGWEMGKIGQSIAQGRGFSSPYGDSTGPSAWEPPLYPFLIGGVFKLFGIYSGASAWALLTINSLFTALTCVPIFFIARRVLGARLALWSGWAWALNPYAMYWSIHWIWDTTFSPFLLTCIFLVSVKMEEWDGWKGWALFGALWGVAGWSNPSMLSFLPCSGIWIWYRRYKNGRRSLAGVVLASVVFFLCLAPWLVRNYQVFGKLVFIRDDVGLQLRLGNGPAADGMLMPYFQPNLNASEFESYRHLGELAYSDRCKRLALRWIQEHPGRFVVISLKRFFYYWDGVPKATDSTAPVDFRNSLFLVSSLLAIWGLARAVKKKLPGAGLFLLLVLSYPTTYYFIYPHARYRHPIEPELLILIVFLLSEIRPRTGTTPLSC